MSKIIWAVSMSKQAPGSREFASGGCLRLPWVAVAKMGECACTCGRRGAVKLVPVDDRVEIGSMWPRHNSAQPVLYYVNDRLF